MIQEIITYIIIAIAFFYAGYRFTGIFKSKRKKPGNVSYKRMAGSGCGSCNAECVMRDTVLAAKNTCIDTGIYKPEAKGALSGR